MAKKKKDKKDGAQADAADSIRAALERGLQLSAEGAQATQKRTRELVDEISAAAGRVRQSLDDMRVLDELRRLRSEIEKLGSRVTALERPGASAASSASAAKPAASRASRPRATKKTTAARKTSSARKSSAAKKSTANKTTARKTTARKTTPRKSAAKKTTATRSRAKKPAAAKASTPSSPSSGSSTSS
jgi:DNA-binding protein HU-beta